MSNSITLQTESLLPASPAIAKGVAAGAPATDARGFIRPAVGSGGKPDAGAFEFENATLSVAVTQTSTASLIVGSVATFSITVTNTSSATLPADNSTLTVAPSTGLTGVSGSPLTFSVAGLAPGASATFTVNAAATALGAQTISAAVASPDTNANSSSGSTAALVLTPNQRFVQALYIDDLHRVATLAELNGWVAILTGPGGSQRVVVSDIVSSFEYRDDLVKSWYLNYLGRPATGGEEDIWANMMPDYTQEDVLSQFLSSTEFYDRAQTIFDTGSADENYVYTLYLVLFNRSASSAEITSQLEVLPGLGYQGLVMSFLQSAEWRTDLITGYYNNLLHRPPDAGGLSYWVNLSQGAEHMLVDAASILVDFEATSEFFTNG